MGNRNSWCSGEMRKYQEEHRWRKRVPGLLLTLSCEDVGANRIRYPGSPHSKRWKLDMGGIDPFRVVANALSFPPGEYGRKAETQKN